MLLLKFRWMLCVVAKLRMGLPIAVGSLGFVGIDRYERRFCKKGCYICDLSRWVSLSFLYFCTQEMGIHMEVPILDGLS